MSVSTSVSDELTRQIRGRIALRGWSVRELERRAGLNERAVLSILQGQSKHPRIDTVLKIANALDCSIDALIGENGVSQPRANEEILYDLVLDFVKWLRTGRNQFPSELSDTDCEVIADTIANSWYDAQVEDTEFPSIIEEVRERAIRVTARRKE